MVGGVVVETVETLAGRVWVNVRGTREDAGRTSAVYLEGTPAALSISPGDSLWWQGESAYWTPAGRAFTDYRIRRMSGSGVSRPPLDDQVRPFSRG